MEKIKSQKNLIPKVIRKTEIKVPYHSRELTFSWPPIGLEDHIRGNTYCDRCNRGRIDGGVLRKEGYGEEGNCYKVIGKMILDKNLAVPTGDYTAALVHAAYCRKEVEDEPEFKIIGGLTRTKNTRLWVFNRNLSTFEGVYVVQDLDAKGVLDCRDNKRERLNKNELEKMLKGGKEIKGVRFSKEGYVRFAPKETFKMGVEDPLKRESTDLMKTDRRPHTPESLAEDGFIIANFGKEGAEKLAEASAYFEGKFDGGGIYSIGDEDENKKHFKKITARVYYNAIPHKEWGPEERVCSIGGSGNALCISSFDDRCTGIGGCAFGISNENAKR